MSIFGFGASASLNLTLSPPPSNTFKDIGKPLTVSSTKDGPPPLANDSPEVRKVPVYTGTDKVEGTLSLTLPQGKKLDHLGIKVELIGRVEMFYDRGGVHDFTSLVKEVDAPGTIYDSKEYPLSFDFEKPYESYRGLNVRVRYFLRATLSRNYSGNLTSEKEICVQHITNEPEINNSIKMEVGIEDCLHIEFEYERQKYGLSDVIVGKIFFLLVRIKIKHMELAVIRRESAGTGQNIYNESETLIKYEIMDGAPVRGECIPVRLFLAGVPGELTPTYRNVGNRFSLKYYINLVLVDEEDRRYFKQQEVTLWRKVLG
ncbi:hypothetical protein TrLO_g12856 [Triparma laevis f. longispina]|uniref:Vacuolar protein sorting-associated protein 26 n=1 Tax=Triparma laevis f. longispina TaxID=1714387 RepID=A0A9W7KZ68_9STRA|nr:hypothetical protein TrLO_g12856 [Triparma laevis f. longispina]